MKKIYFCMDSYMLRSPIFPIEVLIDMLRTDENIIEKISSNHILREGLVGTIVGQLSRQIFMPFIMNLVNVCSSHEHTIPFIA